MPKKQMTYDELERTQAKAVRFLNDVVDDPYKADEFESMSPEEYAVRKGVDIVEENPSRAHSQSERSPTMTISEMKERIAELEEENEDLQSRLDSITDIARPGDEDDEDDEESDEDREDD